MNVTTPNVTSRKCNSSLLQLLFHYTCRKLQEFEPKFLPNGIIHTRHGVFPNWILARHRVFDISDLLQACHTVRDNPTWRTPPLATTFKANGEYSSTHYVISRHCQSLHYRDRIRTKYRNQVAISTVGKYRWRTPLETASLMFIFSPLPPLRKLSVQSKLRLSLLLHSPALTYERHCKGDWLTLLHAPDATQTHWTLRK